MHYHPFYCEENIWHLCQDASVTSPSRHVVFISNPSQTCILYEQQAAPKGEEVIWDYHVVLLTTDHESLVWDLDSRLPIPTPLATYLAKTFPEEQRQSKNFEPLFRVIESTHFIKTFSTDRSHMRDQHNAWLKPPPPWIPPTAPGHTPNLPQFIDMLHTFEGQIFDLDGMRKQFP